MKQVKAEIIDLEYEEQMEWRHNEEEEEEEEEEEDDALMVARKIKQEFCDKSASASSSPINRAPNQIIQENIRVEIEERRPAPLVFDHFICMRIGLNSRNNVQRLMALLTAHEFVDLTVLPTPSLLPPPPMSSLLSLGVHPTRFLAACSQEASTSQGNGNNNIRELEKNQNNKSQLRNRKAIVKKISNRSFIRPSPSADCGIIPFNMQCRKCDEIVPKGSHGSLALNHVQKHHLKMAAFQCRICKHYRTTQERIQSHVTTVHKAKSSTFDSSLAGPLSSEDMRKMEEMITLCFPQLKMELQVTDRLIAKTMEVDLSQRK